MRYIFFGRVIDKETGTVLHYRDDLRRHFGRDRGAAERSAHYTIFVQDPLAHITGAMDDDAPLVGIVIKTLINALDPERKTVHPGIGT